MKIIFFLIFFARSVVLSFGKISQGLQYLEDKMSQIQRVNMSQ